MNWIKGEPVRATLWPLISLAVAYLLGKGWIGQDDADFILAAAVLILGVAGVEIARSKVTPWPPTLETAEIETANPWTEPV